MVQLKLTNYLRTFRKRSHLSQDEVAFLLGSGSGCKVSRYERFARVPNLQTAMAFEVVYGVPIKELFAGIFQKVESQTLRRARLLASRLNKNDSSRLKVVRLKILEQFIPDQAKTGLHESI
jgi:transcriptional regulator with XRE-family HTH domain